MLNPPNWQEKQWHPWMQAHAELVEKMLMHIRENGSVRSADFERTGGLQSGWWNRKDEKTAVEGLWMRGDLMIAKRHHFQRYYDLRERFLPDSDDALMPSLEAVHETFVLNTVKALGIAKATWIANYFYLGKRQQRYKMSRRRPANIRPFLRFARCVRVPLR